MKFGDNHNAYKYYFEPGVHCRKKKLSKPQAFKIFKGADNYINPKELIKL